MMTDLEESQDLLPSKLDKTMADEKTYTVDEAIEKIGFGKFQVKLLAMIGFAWSSDSLEMALLAILAPAIRCHWNLSHWHEAFMTTIVFIGMFLATACWGFLSDNHGRRFVLVLASLGIFFFGLLSSFSINYTMILILRGLVGASMAGVIQGTTLIVEYLPRKFRGLTVNFSSIFWSIGTCFEILLAMFVMPNHGWRWLLFISAWPSCLCVILILIAKYPPESVRFYAGKGQTEKAVRILEKAARNNGTELPEGRLEAVKKAFHHGSIREMFSGGYWKLTVLLWSIWFASHFNIYGLALLTTALYSSSYSCYGASEGELAEDACVMLTAEDYKHFFYVLAADFPAILIVGILSETAGRKWMQALGFFIMAGFFSCLFICTGSRGWTTVFLFGVRCFAAVADIGGYVYTPEVYPTEIRGMALGSCSGFSRLGCMLTPFVSQVLSKHSLPLTLSLYVTTSVIGGVCCLLLPIETKGKGLEEINRDIQKLSLSASDISSSLDKTEIQSLHEAYYKPQTKDGINLDPIERR